MFDMLLLLFALCLGSSQFWFLALKYLNFRMESIDLLHRSDGINDIE